MSSNEAEESYKGAVEALQAAERTLGATPRDQIEAREMARKVVAAAAARVRFAKDRLSISALAIQEERERAAGERRAAKAAAAPPTPSPPSAASPKPATPERRTASPAPEVLVLRRPASGGLRSPGECPDPRNGRRATNES